MMNWISSAYEDRRNLLGGFIGVVRSCADEIQMHLRQDYGNHEYFIREISASSSGMEPLG